MDPQTIKEKIDRLSSLQSQTDVINISFDEIRNQVLTPEIREKLAEIEAERNTALEAAQAGIDQLTADVAMNEPGEVAEAAAYDAMMAQMAEAESHQKSFLKDDLRDAEEREK